jgi:hypothetical protein
MVAAVLPEPPVSVIDAEEYLNAVDERGASAVPPMKSARTC